MMPRETEIDKRFIQLHTHRNYPPGPSSQGVLTLPVGRSVFSSLLPTPLNSMCTSSLTHSPHLPLHSSRPLSLTREAVLKVSVQLDRTGSGRVGWERAAPFLFFHLAVSSVLDLLGYVTGSAPCWHPAYLVQHLDSHGPDPEPRRQALI